MRTKVLSQRNNTTGHRSSAMGNAAGYTCRGMINKNATNTCQNQKYNKYIHTKFITLWCIYGWIRVSENKKIQLEMKITNLMFTLISSLFHFISIF